MMLTENAGVRCQVQSTCPNCGDGSHVVHIDLEDHLFGAKGRWGLRRCDNGRCRLMWLDPMPLPTETHKFYAAYYTHTALAGGDGAGDKPVPVAASRNWRRLARYALSRLVVWRRNALLSGLCHLEGVSPGKLLEIGCGNGRFLLEATKAGWQATGIDFDENAIAAARALPGVAATVGDLHSMKYDDAMFDAIVMNNVIEHLPQPAGVFEECARVLKYGGRLVMITPNSKSVGYKLFGADWRGLEIPRHLHIFSPANLSAMARRAHFRKVSSFSEAGGEAGVSTLLASENTRHERLERPAPAGEGWARSIIRREKVLALLGRDVGEFAVLVAHR